MRPSDVYVGAVELFSILLPGALLTAAAVVAAWDDIGGALQPLLSSEGAQWVAFVLVSYAVGHFVFLFASGLDALVYDRYRKRNWPVADDDAYKEATQLRRKSFDYAPDKGVDTPMNTFAWSKAKLLLQAPAAFADVQRYEADSKFFRSLIIVLPIVGLVFLLQGLWPLLPASVLLAWLSFMRYAERRHKSTEWAYRYVLVLDRLPSPEAR